MGWNSWNAFHTDVTEAKVLDSAKAIVDSGLRDLGYIYVNIDDGWWLKRRTSDGRMQVRTAIFPSAKVGGSETSSFRPFTDKLHRMGLKAGIYTDIGGNSCSQAYDLHSPNLPEGTTAERQIGLRAMCSRTSSCISPIGASTTSRSTPAASTCTGRIALS
jgi:hypothetical protein